MKEFIKVETSFKHRNRGLSRKLDIATNIVYNLRQAVYPMFKYNAKFRLGTSYVLT